MILRLGLTAQQTKQILNLYQKGLGLRYIADRFSLTRAQVDTIRRVNGLPTLTSLKEANRGVKTPQKANNSVRKEKASGKPNVRKEKLPVSPSIPNDSVNPKCKRCTGIQSSMSNAKKWRIKCLECRNEAFITKEDIKTLSIRVKDIIARRYFKDLYEHIVFISKRR